MHTDDVAIRNTTYRVFVENGTAPSAADVATAAGVTLAAVQAAWHRLHDAHAIVLQRDAVELRMGCIRHLRSATHRWPYRDQLPRVW